MSLSICHVLWSVELGGAERVVLDLAKVQRARGHRVSVLSLRSTEGAMAASFARAVETFAAVPKRARGIDPVLPFRLARWFRRNRVAIVHTHNELPLIYAAPGGKLARATVVHTKHGIVAVSAGANRLRRIAARAADVFVAVSDATAAVAREGRECAPEKLTVVINGTDLSRFPAPPESRAAIRSELGIPERARMLVTIGRLVDEKNHALLVRAAAPLLDDDHHLVIVGDGARRDDLRAQVDALPQRRFIHLPGSRQDVPQLLGAADAYALSSDSEGLPIGLLEAWAAGLPVVTTAVGGIPGVVEDEVTGILVPARDEVALRTAIARVLDADGSDGPIAKMAARGRERAVATYSAEQMATAYDALYRHHRGR